MKTSGYSGTPLARKLGIKDNFKIKLINQPDYYFKLFSDMLTGIKNSKDNKTKKDFIHYFATKAEALNRDMKSLKNELEQNGMIWISWHKLSSKIPTDITENIIRDIALKNGLVDIKVCAVDEIWSGLKLVIPVKDRK
jgi:hypothetical protein